MDPRKLLQTTVVQSNWCPAVCHPPSEFRLTLFLDDPSLVTSEDDDASGYLPTWSTGCLLLWAQSNG